MGELTRRTPAPAPAPAPRHGGHPAAPAVPGTAPEPVTRVAWQHPTERVGWEHMPDPAVALLVGAGCCVGDPIAAWATPARVRAHRGGGFSQDIEGWWINAGSFVAVRARRPLAPDAAGSRRFRPTGAPWTVSAVTHRLTGTPRTQRWRKPPTDAAGGAAADPGVRLTQRALDILPATVAEQLGQPTEHGAARYFPTEGGYRERINAYRRIPAAAGERVLVVAAQRSASAFPDPEQAIAAADWVITTVEAVMGAATRSELGGPTATGRAAAAPEPPRATAAPSAAPLGTGGRTELGTGPTWRPRRGRGG